MQGRMASFAGQYEPLVGRETRSAFTQFAASAIGEAETGSGVQTRRGIRATNCSGQASRTLSAIGHPYCQKVCISNTRMDRKSV